MKTTILAFGIVKEIISASEKELELEDHISVAALREKLETDFPEIKKLKSYMVAVNDEYAENNLILKPDDEIAIIPPVSGG